MLIKKVQKNDKNKDKLMIKKMILNCKSCKTGLGDFKNTRNEQNRANVELKNNKVPVMKPEE